MARKPAPGPSLFGEEHMAPVARPVVVAPPVAAPAAPSIMGPPPTAPAAPAPVSAPAPPEPARETIVEAPRLRVVPPVATTPEEEVLVEPNGDGRFVVSLLRHHGTTCAAVLYTRPQLEMLMRRIPAALEVG